MIKGNGVFPIFIKRGLNYEKERIYKAVDTGCCHRYNYSYTCCGYEKYRGINICKNGFTHQNLSDILLLGFGSLRVQD